MTARRHLEQAIALYDVQHHRSHALHYGVDPGVISLSRMSWVLWLLGYPDQALRRNQETLGPGPDAGTSLQPGKRAALCGAETSEVQTSTSAPPTAARTRAAPGPRRARRRSRTRRRAGPDSRSSSPPGTAPELGEDRSASARATRTASRIRARLEQDGGPPRRARRARLAQAARRPREGPAARRRARQRPGGDQPPAAALGQSAAIAGAARAGGWR